MSVRFERFVDSLQEVLGRRPTESKATRFKSALKSYVSETLDKMTHANGALWTAEDKNKVLEALSKPIGSMLSNIKNKSIAPSSVKSKIEDIVAKHVDLAHLQHEAKRIQSLAHVNREVGFKNYMKVVDSNLKNNMLLRNIHRTRNLNEELRQLKSRIMNVRKSIRLT